MDVYESMAALDRESGESDASANIFALMATQVREGIGPVILVTNPSPGIKLMYDVMYMPDLAKCGYAVLLVSVRGTMASEGEWLPFVNEKKDGLAVLD